MANQVNLALAYREGQEREAAETLRAQLRPAEWRLLQGLAAEVIALAESEAQGTRVVVVPASSEAEALRGLGLKPRAG